MDAEKLAWLSFSVFPGIGPVRFRLLIDYFHSAYAAWRAPISDLLAVGLPPNLVTSFDQFRHQFLPVSYLEQLQKLHISILTLNDDKYPSHLKQISDAPFVIYIRGHKVTPPLNLSRTIAIVGTRKVTPYGEEITKQLASDLVAAGCTIVSGLAYGVDAIAHQSALDAGGQTIAVLGCGVDVIAPAVNTRLYNQIISGRGAVISEMPLGLRPGKGLFPARNRIISGLSMGVVVTEGADDSGALITARYAAEQGREVFAVPGPVTSRYSHGPFKLIRDGATLAACASDILEALNLDHLPNSSNLSNLSNLPNPEKALATLLCDGHMHIDQLTRSSGLTISRLSATLSILELKGIIKDYGGKIYGLT